MKLLLALAACSVSADIADRQQGVSVLERPNSAYEIAAVTDALEVLPCRVVHSTARAGFRASLRSGAQVERKERFHEEGTGEHTQEYDTLITARAMRPDDALLALEKACPAGLLVEEELFAEGSVLSTAEVVPLVQNGPSTNRVDVPFMGDGYTRAEREQHHDDMRRLTEEMFNGQEGEHVTFGSFLPLFNIWSVFVPSDESGIGDQGKPRKTAYRLYRDGTELRGIYPDCAKCAREACSAVGEGGCDFPALIGNDAFYGGLGGEFTITTKSHTTGTMVFRHEMGHNFADVGEGYDGGWVYRGANSARSVAQAKEKWAPFTDNDGADIREELNSQIVQDYAWYVLADKEVVYPDYEVKFESRGLSRWMLKYSVSGAETQDSIEVLLDGKKLDWKTSGILDRSFSEHISEEPLSPGAHTLTFRALRRATSDDYSIRQICSITMHEYGAEDAFVWRSWPTPHISAYPTWNAMGRKTYRPDNEFCLMRNMTSEYLSPPVQEAVWMQFLDIMSLIDDVRVHNDVVWVQPVPLAEFRAAPVNNEKYTVHWLVDGERLTDYDDLYECLSPISGMLQISTIHAWAGGASRSLCAASVPRSCCVSSPTRSARCPTWSSLSPSRCETLSFLPPITRLRARTLPCNRKFNSRRSL
ncbi:MAG: hypothetical protein MHM6MM_004558 [Cercozoa sp. M6MM]